MEEYSGLFENEKAMKDIYEHATAAPHSFLYITLGSVPNFFKSFENQLVIK